MGLKPKPHVGASLHELLPKLVGLSEKWGINAAGEGGEFESLVLFCPGLYKKRIKILESDVILESDNYDGAVGYLKVSKVEFEDTQQASPSSKTQVLPSPEFRSPFKGSP